jgi:hypothetical protein
MSNIQDIRAQLRAEQNSSAGSRSMLLPALAAAVVCAVASGIIYVLFLKPVVVPLKPSANIPTFREVSGNAGQSPFAPPRGESVMQAPPSNAAQYADLTPRQTGKLADDVCFARAHAKFPNWSKTPRLTTKHVSDFTLGDMPHVNELMHCLLTEAPARYCSSSQRSTISAEVAMYFRTLEYGNKSLNELRGEVGAAQKKRIRLEGFDPYSEEIAKLGRLEYAADPRIVAAIETRLRDGTLTASDRDAFAATAPQPIRQRLANVKPSTLLCPAQPWWAFWRSF